MKDNNGLESNQRLQGPRERQTLVDRALTDQEILDFVSNSNPDESSTAREWLGVEGSSKDRPFVRFAQILSENFYLLDKNGQEKLLRGAARFVFGNFATLQYNFRHPQVRMSERNIGELLLRSLEFTEGDVDAARALLHQEEGSKSRRAHRSLSSANYALFPFYLSERLAARPGEESISLEYLQKDSKIAELAFWIDADFGNLTFGGRLNQVLNSFSLASAAVQKQILKFVQERLFARGIQPLLYKELRLFISRNQNFVGTDDESTSQITESIQAIKKLLDLDALLEKAKRKISSIDELIDDLEANPLLIGDIKFEELEEMLDRTKDHGLATRIENMIKSKKAIDTSEVKKAS